MTHRQRKIIVALENGSYRALRLVHAGLISVIAIRLMGGWKQHLDWAFWWFAALYFVAFALIVAAGLLHRRWS